MSCILYRKNENDEIVAERFPATEVAFNLSTGVYVSDPVEFEKPKRGRKKKTEEE